MVTTALFLEQFDLKSLRDLPGSGVISALSPLPQRGESSSDTDEMAADDAAAELEEPSEPGSG